MKTFITYTQSKEAPLQASTILREQTFEGLLEVLGEFIREPTYEGVIISQGPKSTNLVLTKQDSLVHVAVVDRSLSDKTILSFKSLAGSKNFKLREKKTKHGVKYLNFQTSKTVDALSELIKTAYQKNLSSDNFVIKIYQELKKQTERKGGEHE